MSYSINELINNFDDYIAKIGVDKKILEHPSFYRIKSDIQNLISRITINESSKFIQVYQDDNKITFVYNVNNGEKYSFSILCNESNEFTTIRVHEKYPLNSYNSVAEKDVVEEVVNISDNGFVNIVVNNGWINDHGIDHNQSNSSNRRTISSRCSYDSDGIMIKWETKNFNSDVLGSSVKNAGIDSILYLPRHGFGHDVFSDEIYYSSYSSLSRLKLDTARLFIDDRNSEFGYKYSVVTPLDREHGLRDMVAVCTPGRHPEGMIINPLLQDEIDSMIRNEKDPKVANGLKKYAVGRDTYSYVPEDDENFVYELISNTSGKHK